MDSTPRCCWLLAPKSNDDALTVLLTFLFCSLSQLALVPIRRSRAWTPPSVSKRRPSTPMLRPPSNDTRNCLSVSVPDSGRHLSWKRHGSIQLTLRGDHLSDNNTPPTPKDLQNTHCRAETRGMGFGRPWTASAAIASSAARRSRSTGPTRCSSRRDAERVSSGRRHHQQWQALRENEEKRSPEEGGRLWGNQRVSYSVDVEGPS